MSGQSRGIQDILMERLKIIQDIAVANSEQLRLNQIANGMMVLEMKDARDGVADCANDEARNRNDAALDDNMTKINRLEEELAALDQELEAAAQKDG
ncbi:MAG: hypothetical protein NXH97_13200 [Rhodobacteraceae bacterium]|nr:hypothetical protein [Paracoccaceae bacterium]